MDNPQAVINLTLIERVQKFDCTTPDLSETALYLSRQKLPWEKTDPVALASEHLFTCNVRPRKTLRCRISIFRAILR